MSGVNAHALLRAPPPAALPSVPVTPPVTKHTWRSVDLRKQAQVLC